MTMQRGSIVFAAEGYQKGTNKSNFSRGRGYYKNSEVRCDWIAPPPGTFFGTTHNRQASPIRAMGTKKWDTVQYGSVTGSFNWSFTLDYKYLHMLTFIFEDYQAVDEGVETENGYRVHTFKKKDNARVKSFTIRRTILNEMAGGLEKSDEIEQLFGCVIVNASFVRSAGSSQISVSLTGFYVSERMYKGTLTNGNYQQYNGQLTEYMCMLVSDDRTATLDNCIYVANTESVTIDIGNNAEKIFNVCSPFAGAYFEGLTNYSLSTSIYSNNPEVYKQRVYGGGSLVPTGGGIIIPKVKNLAPLHTVKLITYDGQTDTTEPGSISQEKMLETYDNSLLKLCINVEDMVIKSLTWPKGEGQKISDNISSAECKSIEMVFKSRKNTLYHFEDMESFDLCENADNAPLVRRKAVLTDGGPDW